MTIENLFTHLKNHLEQNNLQDFSAALDQYLQDENYNIDELVSFSTLLMIAAEEGNLEACELLIKKGANIGATNKSGITPLISAARQGQVVIVEYLIKQGASLDAQSTSGASALSSAALGGHTEVVKILLQSGATLNIKGSKQNNPLTWAAYFGHEETAAFLIGKKVEVENSLKFSVTEWQQHGYKTAQPVIYKMLKNAGRLVLPFSNSASRSAKANRSRHNNIITKQTNTYARELAHTPLNKNVASLVCEYLSVDASVHKIFENVFVSTKSMLFAEPCLKKEAHEKPDLKSTASKRVKYTH